jgi:hypothetical protein
LPAWITLDRDARLSLDAFRAAHDFGPLLLERVPTSCGPVPYGRERVAQTPAVDYQSQTWAADLSAQGNASRWEAHQRRLVAFHVHPDDASTGPSRRMSCECLDDIFGTGRIRRSQCRLISPGDLSRVYRRSQDEQLRYRAVGDRRCLERESMSEAISLLRHPSKLLLKTPKSRLRLTGDDRRADPVRQDDVDYASRRVADRDLQIHEPARIELAQERLRHGGLETVVQARA